MIKIEKNVNFKDVVLLEGGGGANKKLLQNRRSFFKPLQKALAL
jgi:hypothetical protein